MQAVKDGAKLRLRPKVMTAATAIAGLLPNSRDSRHRLQWGLAPTHWRKSRSLARLKHRP